MVRFPRADARNGNRNCHQALAIDCKVAALHSSACLDWLVKSEHIHDENPGIGITTMLMDGARCEPPRNSWNVETVSLVTVFGACSHGCLSERPAILLSFSVL